MQNSLAPLNLKEATRGLESVLREKEQAIQQQEYELAAELRDREVKLRDRIAKLESGWHRVRGSEKPSVGEEEIAQIVSMWTGIPVMRMAQEEAKGDTGRGDRKSAAGCLQHAAPDPGGWQVDRRQGPHGGFPQYRGHHDLERGCATAEQGSRDWLPAVER